MLLPFLLNQLVQICLLLPRLYLLPRTLLMDPVSDRIVVDSRSGQVSMYLGFIVEVVSSFSLIFGFVLFGFGVWLARGLLVLFLYFVSFYSVRGQLVIDRIHFLYSYHPYYEN